MKGIFTKELQKKKWKLKQMTKITSKKKRKNKKKVNLGWEEIRLRGGYSFAYASR